jgi:hypothetical protein
MTIVLAEHVNSGEAFAIFRRRVIYEEEPHPEIEHGGASPRKALDRMLHAN